MFHDPYRYCDDAQDHEDLHEGVHFVPFRFKTCVRWDCGTGYPIPPPTQPAAGRGTSRSRAVLCSLKRSATTSARGNAASASVEGTSGGPPPPAPERERRGGDGRISLPGGFPPSSTQPHGCATRPSSPPPGLAWEPARSQGRVRAEPAAACPGLLRGRSAGAARPSPALLVALPLSRLHFAEPLLACSSTVSDLGRPCKPRVDSQETHRESQHFVHFPFTFLAQNLVASVLHDPGRTRHRGTYPASTRRNWGPVSHPDEAARPRGGPGARRGQGHHHGSRTGGRRSQTSRAGPSGRSAPPATGATLPWPTGTCL